MSNPELREEMPLLQIPGVYHRRIGDITVTALSDGYIDGTLDLLQNIDLETARSVLVDSFRPVRRISVNTFLVRSKGRLALIDTGAALYRPTTGKLLKNLAAAGVDRRLIDTILLTHMHPDHSAGLVDNETSEPVFPNAELVLHENEANYWHDDGHMSAAEEHVRTHFFLEQRRHVAPYKTQTRLFSGGEVFPGVTALPSFGHTPGHTTYLVASGDDQLLIWGDLVHLPEVQTAHPEAGILFDVDGPQAILTRKRVFDQVAADRILVAGMHLHFPGFNYLGVHGDGYRLYPEAWLHEL